MFEQDEPQFDAMLAEAEENKEKKSKKDEELEKWNLAKDTYRALHKTSLWFNKETSATTPEIEILKQQADWLYFNREWSSCMTLCQQVSVKVDEDHRGCSTSRMWRDCADQAMLCAMHLQDWDVFQQWMKALEKRGLPNVQYKCIYECGQGSFQEALHSAQTALKDFSLLNMWLWRVIAHCLIKLGHAELVTTVLPAKLTKPGVAEYWLCTCDVPATKVKALEIIEKFTADVGEAGGWTITAGELGSVGDGEELPDAKF
eukprot:TRINITY_DN55168_c0_g1_i1.p1 TRINITY_DN55168_c0_g1~~TRINITY_DN55168_c0_g1_i1.p1  ORF type:complete len:269 (+),score=25.92 TRINITY_DN55168_c0_g1_i1:31-807(+)